jgi:hypothetical protein
MKGCGVHINQTTLPFRLVLNAEQTENHELAFLRGSFCFCFFKGALLDWRGWVKKGRFHFTFLSFTSSMNEED